MNQAIEQISIDCGGHPVEVVLVQDQGGLWHWSYRAPRHVGWSSDPALCDVHALDLATIAARTSVSGLPSGHQFARLEA